MAEPKMKQNNLSVDAYLDAIADDMRRQDCRKLIAIMKKATGAPPTMWGTSIVGFGKYHYRYESGHEGDSCLTGFSSRKPDLVVYFVPGFKPFESLVAKVGKHKIGKSCFYVRRLADVDIKVLTQMIGLSVEETRRRHPDNVGAD
jgi:Domain of unknown function (DU1801)